MAGWMPITLLIALWMRLASNGKQSVHCWPSARNRTYALAIQPTLM